MKNYFFIIFLLITLNSAWSQNHQPQAFEITADTAINENISDKYWQLLEDPTGKLTIGEVSSPGYDSKFHGNTTLTKGYDYHITNYWLRYKLINKLPYPVKFTIPESVAYAWLYKPAANGKWMEEETGTLVPWSKRSGLKLIHQFEIEMQPGQQTLFYEHDVFDFSLYKPENFKFTIGFADQVISQNYINNDTYYYKNILSALIIGVLLMAAMVNIFFYRVTKEKLYLYFSLFLIFVGFYYLLVDTDIQWIREHPYIKRNLLHFILIGEFFTLMHFIRYFLSTKIKTPRWDSFLIVLSYLIISVFIRSWYIPPNISYQAYLTFNFILNILEFGYMPVIFCTILYHLFKYKNLDRTGIYALIPIAGWWSVAYTYTWIDRALFDFYHHPRTQTFIWIESSRFLVEFACFFWLVLIFSWTLFKRFQVLQQNVAHALLEKERIEKEKEIERSHMIEHQKVELELQVASRTSELRQSIAELKATQTQLIQSEKMASLGELTAGIAHEIQNPLNFVNNFSEVNKEMVEELEQELKKGNIEEALSIAADIKGNEEKINHHGKRADFIVKGMLQHSRTGTGEKQPTNINILADEFLRLSYHGLRAKDKNFNAELITRFDENLPKVNIVQQDIGRVLLNLFNNAFYAVNQKQKTAGIDYKPEVTVSTTINKNNLIISVKDNGNGIPDAIKDKIMQPFFTTKPTGEGTGLGLSLSYDIVVKGHGGSITVDTKEGEGSEFTIHLPII
jgi:signal transduction histidine kinase